MLAGRSLLPSSSAVAALVLLPVGITGGGMLFWPAACLVALGAALERDHRAMLAYYGLALGFDAQAGLMAPFFIAVAIQRRVPLAALPGGIACAAAMLLVRAATGALPTLVFPLEIAVTQDAPNLWALARVLPGMADLPLIGLAFAATAGAAAAYTAWFAARPVSDRALLEAALLGSLVAAMLAPGAGARIFCLADLLALMLAIDSRGPARWRIATLLVSGSGVAMAGADWLPLAALATLSATMLHARAVLQPAANDNPLMARAY